MRQHRPEAPKRLGRDTWTELRNVALQVRAYEIAPPLKAAIVRLCQEARRKPAPHPQRIYRLRAGLKNVERSEFQIGDSTRQALSGLLEQAHGGRSQEQKPSIGFSLAASPVNNAAELLKDLRRPVDLIEDDQLVFVVFEVLRGIEEFRPVALVLQVEVSRLSLPGNL